MGSIENKKEDFLNYMGSSSKDMELGFQLLVERDLITEFFAELKEREFLRPTSEFEQKIVEGRIHAPYWPPLIYFEAILPKLTESRDANLSREICELMEFAIGCPHPNYRTNVKILELIGLFPDDLLTDSLLSSIKDILITKYDNSLTLHIFTTRLIDKFLANDRYTTFIPTYLDKLFQVAIEKDSRSNNEQPEFVADHYWLKTLSEKSAKQIGERLGLDSLSILRNAANNIFHYSDRAYPTWLIRPSIEDHDQNKDWYGSENIAVIALRNFCLGIALRDTTEFKDVVTLLYGGAPIEIRIAIHLMDQILSKDTEFLISTIDDSFFNDENLHEGYLFLQNNFHAFPEPLKARLIELLQSKFTISEAGEKSNVLLRKKYRWISSIQNSDREDIRDILNEIKSNAEIALPENPEFFTFMQSGWGPGPSPYSADEISYFIDSSQLIEKLNTFEGSGDIFSPNRRALCDAFEETITRYPERILPNLDEYKALDTPYKYSIVHAFSGLFAKTPTNSASKYDGYIEPILLWMFDVFLKNGADLKNVEADDSDTPNFDWIISSFTDLIKTLTRDDDNAFNSELRLNCLEVLKYLISVRPPLINNFPKDPMSNAINSYTGRLLESLILLALRHCRQQEKERGSHTEAWSHFVNIFNEQINSVSQNSNFEFSTLLSRYTLQFNFMNSEWIKRNQKLIFNPPLDYSFICAMDGFAYAPAAPLIYEGLQASGAIFRGFDLLEGNSIARTKLIERIALAYSWGEIDLNSEPINRLFNKNKIGDLKIALNFFWSISNQEITLEQNSLIIIFWRRAKDLLDQNFPSSQPDMYEILLKMVSYFEKIDDSDLITFKLIISRLQKTHSTYFLADELLRLFEENKHAITTMAALYVKKIGAFYDYEQKWLTLTKLILNNGFRKEASSIMNELQSQAGFPELYNSLT